MASARPQPKVRSAAGFQAATRPAASIDTNASVAVSRMAPVGRAISQLAASASSARTASWLGSQVRGTESCTHSAPSGSPSGARSGTPA